MVDLGMEVSAFEFNVFSMMLLLQFPLAQFDIELKSTELNDNT